MSQPPLGASNHDLPQLPLGAVVLCTLQRKPSSESDAVRVRKLFNCCAEDRPRGRGGRKQSIRPNDQRRITIAGARLDALRNDLRTLVANGTLTVVVDGR